MNCVLLGVQIMIIPSISIYQTFRHRCMPSSLAELYYMRRAWTTWRLYKVTMCSGLSLLSSIDFTYWILYPRLLAQNFPVAFLISVTIYFPFTSFYSFFPNALSLPNVDGYAVLRGVFNFTSLIWIFSYHHVVQYQALRKIKKKKWKMTSAKLSGSNFRLADFGRKLIVARSLVALKRNI